jgi:hypothetical protein
MISRNILVVAVALFGGAAVQAFVAPAQQGVTRTLSTPLAFVSLHHQQHHVATLRKPTAPSNTVLFMGWGPEPIWSPATISTNQSANKSGKSVSLTVAVPPETAQAYKIPGQYVQLRLNADTKPLFLAISSAPDTENAVFEFLIKKTDDNAWITDASAGTAVEMSQVLGGGFPMAENLDSLKFDFPTQNILLFGVGSGIAPLKAAMESGTFVFVFSTSRESTARRGERGGGTTKLTCDTTWWEKCPYDLLTCIDANISVRQAYTVTHISVFKLWIVYWLVCLLVIPFFRPTWHLQW